MPDDEAGPLLQAYQQDPQLPIKFAVATDPESHYAAQLESVSTAARLNALGEHVIDVKALVVEPTRVTLSKSLSGKFDPFHGDSVRSGADVTARIGCGRRSLLRSWFSDVFDFMHRNVFFYFR